MKTAIQTACNEIVDELIDKIELAHLTKIIHIMHKHLETEKQQIIEAYNSGFKDAIESESKADYYDEIFKTNK